MLTVQIAIYVASGLGATGLVLLLPRARRLHGVLRVLGGVLALSALGLLWLSQAPRVLEAASGLDDGAWPFYYIFSAIGLAAAVRVITHTKPVYSALYFVLVVVASSGLFLTLNAEFMAAAMVVIYGGAILVTYMFVIMLATQSAGEINAGGAADERDPDEADTPLYERAAREPVWAAVAGFVLLAVLLSLAFQPVEPNLSAAAPTNLALVDPALPTGVLTDRPLVIDGGTGLLQPAAVGNTERVGLDLFLANPLAIELAGVVLLLSLIGAVVLARLKLQDEDRALVQAETGVSSEEVQPAGGTAT